MDEFELMVIGTGSAAQVAAGCVRNVGPSVADDLTADNLKAMMFAHPAGASDIRYML